MWEIRTPYHYLINMRISEMVLNPKSECTKAKTLSSLKVIKKMSWQICQNKIRI